MRSPLAAVLLCAALLQTACSDTPTPPVAPTPPAPPPAPVEVPPAPVARLAVTVDGQSGNTAIQNGSTVTLDASGSSGVGLRYGLDFGDGQGVDLSTGAHVYQGTGTYKVRVIVTDSLGRTDQASAEVTVKNVTGAWFHGFYNSNALRYESRTLTIAQQNGRSVAGSYTHPEGWASPFTGDVSARGATLNLNDGTITFASVAGGGFNADLTALSVKVRGGSADGFTLTFTRSASSGY